MEYCRKIVRLNAMCAMSKMKVYRVLQTDEGEEERGLSLGLIIGRLLMLALGDHD